MGKAGMCEKLHPSLPVTYFIENGKETWERRNANVEAVFARRSVSAPACLSATRLLLMIQKA
jgi:hypothetical protein